MRARSVLAVAAMAALMGRTEVLPARLVSAVVAQVKTEVPPPVAVAKPVTVDGETTPWQCGFRMS